MTVRPRAGKKHLFSKLADELLSVLDERSKDIITRRFGLVTGEKDTLESIGKEYSITRERVRQIESQAKKQLSSRLEILAPAMKIIEKVFAEHGGVLLKEQAAELVHVKSGEPVLPTVVYFFLELVPPYTYVTTDGDFAPHWRHPDYVTPVAGEAVRIAAAILQKAKHPKAEAELLQDMRREFKATVSDVHLKTWLAASRSLRKNPFGEWGLVGWAETTPRGVGDKAYAVLRRHAKPEHFRKIADLINAAHFDRKVANAQTVHNELIKDDRFVLVGRGLYGLTEWGYMPGTVADVLESILKRSQQPLSREELIEQVLSQRLVKKNTILLSLQDQSRFVKTAENRYTLREKS
jgi:hypothetical protein